MPDILLSLKPRFSKAILNGHKTFEYRRVRPNLEPDDWVFMYETSPTCAIVGAFQVGQVLEGAPAHLWSVSSGQSGLHRPEFDGYFTGAETGVAIEVAEVVRFTPALSLDVLRQSYGGFQAPQSFRYVANLPSRGHLLRDLMPHSE